MFEGKKGKIILFTVITLIIVVLGTLVYFIVDFIKSSKIESDAADAVDQFIGEVNNKNEQKNKVTNTDQEDVQINIELSNLIIGGGTATGSTSEKTYKGFPMIGTIEIPKISLKSPILNSTSKEAIKVAVAIDNGVTELNLPGITVIAGHNYRNGTFFSDLKILSKGDKVYITDLQGNKVEYKVYDTKTIETNEPDYLYKDTQGKREVILKTCTDDTQSRLLVYASAD